MRSPLMKRMNILKSQRGFSVVAVLGIVAVEAVIAISILSWQESGRANLQKQKVKIGSDTVFEQITANLYQTQAWEKTAQGNNCLLTGKTCVAGSVTPLVLKAIDGSVLVNSTVATDGFNMNGQRCSAADGVFNSVQGNDACPFHYALSATPINCVSGVCDVQINGVMTYLPNSKKFRIPLNLNRYGLNYIRGREQGSLQASCLALGGLFDQKLLTCTPPAFQGAVCPPHQVLKTLIQGQDPVCITFFDGSFECPPGQAASGIKADGSLTCKVVL